MSKVSIIIPSYNHAKYLKQRLQTILNQTYTDWEAIIIDDKSSDNSVEIIRQFIKDNPDFKVKSFIVNEQNSGSGYKSWQKGIELAETEFIWIAETDDYSDIHFLEELVSVLDTNKEVALAFTGSNYVDDKNCFLYNSSNRTKDLNVNDGDYKLFEAGYYIDKVPFETYITNGSSVLFRKPKIKIPFEIFDNFQSSDIFLWTYLLQGKKFIFLNKNLNFFRRHEDSTTTKSTLNRQKELYVERIKFIEYFQYLNKYEFFVNHYFENYVWNHKKEYFNLDIFKLKKGLVYIYIKNLVFNTFKKLFDIK